jgi:hypothetical protein
VWKWRKRTVVPNRETRDALIARTPDLRDLLIGLGYDGPVQATAEGLMKELNSSIRAEVTDFAALQKAVATAMTKREGLPENVSAFLRSLAEAPDHESILRLLNADPVHDQVPYIEQVPVLKRGVVTWQSPVQHTLIRKRPADIDQFRRTLTQFETLFFDSHPARSEQARIAVLDAVTRLRREVEREKAYLPTPMQALEARLTDYAGSIKPKVGESMRMLFAILDRLVELRNRMEETGIGDAPAVAEQTVRYLSTPRVQTPGLTSYILSLLLDSRITATTRRVSKASLRAMDLIRAEVAGGNYDGEETARRLRQLEPEGFLAPSLVFPLLQLPVAEAVKLPIATTGDRLITLAKGTRLQPR